MRGRSLVIAALAGAAISGTAAAEAGAQATATVNAAGGNTWSPNNPTVYTGGIVTFNNTTGVTHDIVVGGVEIGMDASMWTGRQYTAPATPGPVGFLCTLHGGMSGTINVVAAPTTPTTPAPNPTTPTTPTPQPTTPTTPGVDSTAPKITRVTTSRNLRRAIVRFRLDEDATVTARLRRRGQTRTLKRVTRELDAGNRSVTLRKALRAGARYQVVLRIQDAAGNVTNRTVNFTAPRS
jgi:plastocyanin